MEMEPLQQTASVLYVLGAAIAGGFGILGLLRFRHQSNARQLNEGLAKHQDYFAYLSVQMDEAQALLPPPGSLTRMELRAVQSKLLEWIETIRGPHRDKLTALCRDMGLIDMELRRLNSPWHAVRVEAAYHLGVMRAGECAEALLKLLEREIAESTAFVVGRAAAKCAQRPEELRRLISLLMERHPHAQQLTADILSASSLDPSPLYAEILDTETNPALLKLALTGLSGGSRPCSLASLERLLRSEDADVRLQAARLLLRYPQVLPPGRVGELLAHPDGEIRAAAAQAVGEHQLLFYTEPLKASLADPDWRVRYGSAQSLIRLGLDGFEVLCEAARDMQAGPAKDTVWNAIHEAMDLSAAAAEREMRQIPLHSEMSRLYRTKFQQNYTSPSAATDSHRFVERGTG
ncbi:HEAT repeat domain-containing protein [Paenibacillus sp. 32352]|uniref:HEAT repeat domain-containing protein n=1 Tax=Paenibacillus sp. 32352 TaxID=1969111 RepID=UPI0009AED2B2|nr:HEAT repeat domain-containing protein [Paenibacillus sp. 32352]